MELGLSMPGKPPQVPLSVGKGAAAAPFLLHAKATSCSADSGDDGPNKEPTECTETFGSVGSVRYLFRRAALRAATLHHLEGQVAEVNADDDEGGKRFNLVQGIGRALAWSRTCEKNREEKGEERKTRD